MRIVIFIIGVYLSCSYGEVRRPRGVSISKASLYRPNSEFKCLDGSTTIPFEWINDEYCDCADGSDEPGTSACPNGFFHCTNSGYRPTNVPSSRVNDGICDCCDGTDEYSGIVSCENTCIEMGRKMREEETNRRQHMAEGHNVYKQYVEKGNEARREKQIQLEQLGKEKSELETEKARLEAVKLEMETPEKEAKDLHQKNWEEEKARLKNEEELRRVEESFRDLDVNGDGTVDLQEMANRREFDIDANGEVSLDEAKEYLEDSERVNFATYQDHIWPNIKEIYKKPGSSPIPDRTTDGYPVTTTPTPPVGDAGEIPVPPAASTDPPPVVDDTSETGDDGYNDDDEEDDDRHLDNDAADEKDDDIDGNDDNEDYDKYKKTHRREEERKGEDKAEVVEEEKVPEYDEQTKALIEEADKARQAFNEVDNRFKDVENRFNEAKKFLELDLGPNNEFYPLKGACYEYSDREYTYKLCPFDSASQRSKSGGGDTRLGSWGHWAGPPDDKYSAMKYERGQNCWNGPDRSVMVIMTCGMDNELKGASEPNRCEYQFQFTTPAVCLEPPSTSGSTLLPTDHDHQEL